MSNKLISSILDPVYGYYGDTEQSFRECDKLTATLAQMAPELSTPGPDHP